MTTPTSKVAQAAELLGIRPERLQSLLDARFDAVTVIDIARERQARILDRPRVDPEDARTLARCFRELDIHLSAGGELPDEWRNRRNR